MKNSIKSLTTAIFLGTILCFIIASCKKKNTATQETSSNNSNGSLMLHFHTNADTNEVDTYDKVYTMTGGRKISVSLAQLYVSGIQLVRTDGSIFDVSGLNILKAMEIEQYLAGAVPSGNYKSIRFNVGLSPNTNTISPTSNDSIFNKPTMWFGNAAQPSGYVFVNFQGKIDTSANANGTVQQMQAFIYRIGTNTHLKDVMMPDQNFSIIPNQTQFLHIVVDYNKLFKGIKLNLLSNLNLYSLSDNAAALSNQIANNIPAMFSYEM
ncbi:MAG: MbnP family protein [Bacteroidota bacterium]